MTLAIAIVLGLLVAAIILFATEKISVDLITLLLLIALVTSGILKPAEAFEGFSNDILIILGAIFVISGALNETGVLDMIGVRLMRAAGASPTRLVFVLMATVAGVSAFMNNTTATAMFTPPAIGLARRSKIAPSKLLMPVAFASILGGTVTLIGTSTNIAVSGYIAKAGLPPLGLFEFTPLGLMFVAVGIAYMMFIGIRLLPNHDAADFTAGYAMREYLSEIIVMPGSPLIGETCYDSDLTVLDFRVLKIIRGGTPFVPDASVVIMEGDTLLIEGIAANLMKVKKIEGIEIKPEVKLGDRDLQGANLRIAEVLVTPKSELAGSTLKESNFRQASGLTVLAINRFGQALREQVGDTILRVGDVLLVQGPVERVSAVAHSSELAILDEVPEPFYDPRKGFYTIALFIVAILIGALGWVPISIAFLSAAVATVLLRCISVEKAYEFIDWKLLILIGGMTAFGTAMEKTHAAAYLADLIVTWLAPFGPRSILAGFFLLTVLLTQPMSNAAAALVVLPVAMQTAARLHASPRAFAIAIMLAASVSFIAPFEPSCIIVYGPGRYKFMDFVKVGSGLTLVLTILVLLAEPYFFPLF